jgi:hypothetical protein
LLASVTWKVRRDPTSADGVPLITPVNEFSVSPRGSLPDGKFQVYGPVPPVAARVCEYGVPTTPLLSAVVVIAKEPIVWAVMVSVKLEVALCGGVLESVTLNVKGTAVAIPAGVPVIAPVVALSVMGAGRVPEVNCHV